MKLYAGECRCLPRQISAHPILMHLPLGSILYNCRKKLVCEWTEKPASDLYAALGWTKLRDHVYVETNLNGGACILHVFVVGLAAVRAVLWEGTLMRIRSKGQG